MMDKPSAHPEHILQASETDNVPNKVVSILYYDPVEHKIDPDIHVSYTPSQEDEEKDEAKTEEDNYVVVSEQWMRDYRKWNTFGDHEGCPHFDSLDDLREFNAKGDELAKQLQEDLADDDTVIVEPFKPIYKNVAVGDAVCAWWHVKDINYGLVIPIQRLPISDTLKSRFQCWRFRKLTGWLDPATRAELNLEGHDLEEHLLWELNVTPLLDDAGDVEIPPPPCTGKLSLKELAKGGYTDRAIIAYDKRSALHAGIP